MYVKSIVNKIPINVAKLILALLTSSVLIVNLFTIDRINNINANLSERKNEATWFILQLVKEYSNLITQVSTTPYSPSSVNLAYDLTWSRFDIILTSKESVKFISQANYRAFFEHQFDKFKILEKSLKLTEKQPELRYALRKRVQLNYANIINFINDKFQIENPISKQYRVQLNNLLVMQKASSIALIILVIFIYYVFWIEGRLRNKIKRTDPLTGTLNRSALNEDTKDNSSWGYYDLLSIRIHNVSEVNQKYGIDYGDVIIKTTAKRVISTLDSKYQIYRYSGAQFIVLHKKSEKPSMDNSFQSLKEALASPLEMSDMTLVLDVSIIQDTDLELNQLLERLTQLSRRPLSVTL